MKVIWTACLFGRSQLDMYSGLRSHRFSLRLKHLSVFSPSILIIIIILQRMLPAKTGRGHKVPLSHLFIQSCQLICPLDACFMQGTIQHKPPCKSILLVDARSRRQGKYTAIITPKIKFSKSALRTAATAQRGGPCSILPRLLISSI